MEHTKERLKTVFDSLKKKGYFKEYKSYEDWSKKNEGEVEPEQKKLIEEGVLEKESEKKIEEFKKEMPPEEREQFEKIF